LDIAGHRLFKPIGIKKDEIDKRSFLKLSFANKGLDGINLGIILHHKSVKSKIPPYLKDQSVPIISYAHTIPIESTMFNYKHVLHDLNIDDFKSNPHSPFIDNPAGYVITGDLEIINNTSLRDLFTKGK
jgi:hypothetical protein